MKNLIILNFVGWEENQKDDNGLVKDLKDSNIGDREVKEAN